MSADCFCLSHSFTGPKSCDLKAVQVKRLNWLWRKLTAAFWVSAACGIIWYTNFFRRSAHTN